MFKRLSAHEKICTCDCHKEGVDILHFMPCCQLTYQKYIEKDGSINHGKLFRILNPEQPKKRKHRRS